MSEWADIARPAGMTLRQVTAADAKTFAASVRRECAATLSRPDARFENSYLSFLGLYEFYGAEFWGVFDGQMVTLHVAGFGKSPRKNAWGRYVTHYLAFTRPGARGFGYGAHGERDLQAIAAERGYDRLKTLCQSPLGVFYHEHLRDRMWGVNAKGELSIDSPLHDGPWPDGVPIKARQANRTGAELTDAEFRAVVVDPAGRFRMDGTDADRILAKRHWRREQGFEPAGPPKEPTTGGPAAPSATQPSPQGHR